MASELQEQAECFQWHNKSYPEERGMLRRIKNELDNHPRKSKKDFFAQIMENKSTGIIAGTPDFMYFGPTGLCFIEGKRRDGTLSNEQKEFFRLCELFDIACFAYWGIEQFKELINELHR